MFTPISSFTPLPIPDGIFALFLDIDGTLAPIAESPAMAAIPHETIDVLQQLYHRMDGAVAFISGRNVEDIDRMLKPHIFPAAGQHGLEIRIQQPPSQLCADEHKLMKKLSDEVAAFNATYPELLFESKGLSIAVHYRNLPQLENIVNECLEKLAERYAPDVLFQTGKMVSEIRLRVTDKGQAIQQILQSPPFKGRLPVFAGDDTTDEDGFKAINALKGISIKVGEGKTNAAYRVHNPGQIHDWLKDILAHLTPPQSIKKSM